MTRKASRLLVSLVATAVSAVILESTVGTSYKQGGGVFTSRADVVPLEVVVIDREHKPVGGLQIADFVVEVNGRRVKPQALNMIDLGPSMRTMPADAGTDVRHFTNEGPDNGRLVTILFDRSIPAGSAVGVARAIAREIVAHLGPGDQAAVVRSSGFVNEGRSVGFTADKAGLLAVVESPFTGMVSVPEMTSAGLRNAAPTLLESGDCVCGLCTMEAIEGIAEAQATVRNRYKMLIVIGSDMVLQADRASPACSTQVTRQRKLTFDALERSSLVVNTIDPSGLETLTRNAGDSVLDGRQTAAELLRRQGNLAVLPDLTGGRSVVGTNAPEKRVEGLFDETALFYVVGVPLEARSTASTISITTTRPELTVRTRRELSRLSLPSLPTQLNTLEGVVKEPLPRSDVPLEMDLAYGFDADGQTVVTAEYHIHAPVSTLKSSLHAAVFLLDSHGAVLGRTEQAVALPVGVETPDVVSRLSFPLPQSAVEVRLGVVPDNGAWSSSVFGTISSPGESGGMTFSSPTFSRPPVSARQQIRSAPYESYQDVGVSIQLRRIRKPQTKIVLNVTSGSGASEYVEERTLPALVREVSVEDLDFMIPSETLSAGSNLISITALSGRDTAVATTSVDVGQR